MKTFVCRLMKGDAEEYTYTAYISARDIHSAERKYKRFLSDYGATFFGKRIDIQEGEE